MTHKTDDPFGREEALRRWPAPVQWHYAGPLGYSTLIKDDQGRPVAAMYGPGERTRLSGEEAARNSLLVQAAPKLLWAVQIGLAQGTTVWDVRQVMRSVLVEAGGPFDSRSES